MQQNTSKYIAAGLLPWNHHLRLYFYIIEFKEVNTWNSIENKSKVFTVAPNRHVLRTPVAVCLIIEVCTDKALLWSNQSNQSQKKNLKARHTNTRRRTSKNLNDLWLVLYQGAMNGLYRNGFMVFRSRLWCFYLIN